MVSEWLIQTLESIWSWFVSSLPAPDVPGWFSDASSGLSQISTLLGSVSVWLPVGLIGFILATWAAAWVAGVAIKFARIILSLFTAGGGSAA